MCSHKITHTFCKQAWGLSSQQNYLFFDCETKQSEQFLEWSFSSLYQAASCTISEALISPADWTAVWSVSRANKATWLINATAMAREEHSSAWHWKSVRSSGRHLQPWRGVWMQCQWGLGAEIPPSPAPSPPALPLAPPLHPLPPCANSSFAPYSAPSLGSRRSIHHFAEVRKGPQPLLQHHKTP